MFNNHLNRRAFLANYAGGIGSLALTYLLRSERTVHRRVARRLQAVRLINGRGISRRGPSR